MGFKTMDEFKAALADLVRTAKTNGRSRRRKARRNMAIEYGGAKFETPEEFFAFKQLEARQAGASRASSAPQKAEPLDVFVSGLKTSPRKEARKAAKAAGASLPTKAQARNIARAVGWWSGFCPSAAGTGMTPAEVLGGMGLTQARAQAVIEAFVAAGLPAEYAKPQSDEHLAAQAREILSSVGKVRCQTSARANTASFNRFVNWTAYPQYAYDAYAKPNSKGRRKRTKTKRARRNSDEAPKAEFVPDPLIDNAGPYTPHIYPYGINGVPGSYAVKNGVSELTRVRAARAGKTLSGGTEWPVHDREHAILAIRYMAAGFGGAKWRAKYPVMLRRLARLWPLEDDRNRDIWTAYRKHRTQIQTYTDSPVPTVAQLRGVA